MSDTTKYISQISASGSSYELIDIEARKKLAERESATKQLKEDLERQLKTVNNRIETAENTLQNFKDNVVVPCVGDITITNGSRIGKIWIENVTIGN